MMKKTHATVLTIYTTKILAVIYLLRMFVQMTVSKQ